MLGAPGTYSEQQTGLVAFAADCPVNVVFAASELRYAGPGFRHSPVLNVTYWVGTKYNRLYSFRPGRPLELYLDGAVSAGRVIELEIFGDVEIKDIHDQPAGPYEGSIIVTISAAQGGDP